MRRRQILAQLNSRDNRAHVPSCAGMGAAAVEAPSPVSAPLTREEEEARAQIWEPSFAGQPGDVHVWKPVAINLDQFMTPGTDPEAAPLVKKMRGWPKGKKRGPKHAR
jgi:hypothetical protein